MSEREWGTDYWGETLSEPSEEHARKVARSGGANIYNREPGGDWIFIGGYRK